jgi:hypothetical protein
MRETLEETMRLKVALEEKYYVTGLANAGLKKEVQVCREEMGIFKENEGKLEAYIGKLTE